MICQLFFFPSSQSEQFGQKCESFKRVDGDHLTLIMEVIVDAFSPLFNYCHSSCKLVDRGFVNDIIGLVLDNEPLVTLHRLATQMILTTAALSQTEECNRWFSRRTITLVFLLLFLILSNRWDTFRSAQKSYPSRFSGLGFGLAVSCGWFITLIKNWNNRFCMDCHETTAQISRGYILCRRAIDALFEFVQCTPFKTGQLWQYLCVWRELANDSMLLTHIRNALLLFF